MSLSLSNKVNVIKVQTKEDRDRAISVLKRTYDQEKHWIYDADDFRRSFPDGRMGSNPKLSTAEHGARFLEIATDELAESYQAFVANR